MLKNGKVLNRIGKRGKDLKEWSKCPKKRLIATRGYKALFCDNYLNIYTEYSRQGWIKNVKEVEGG